MEALILMAVAYAVVLGRIVFLAIRPGAETSVSTSLTEKTES